MFSRGTQGQGDRGQKRFFKCGACPFRTQTLNRPFPSKPCPVGARIGRAGGVRQQRRAASRRARVRGGHRHEQNMLPRGVEHDFALNSLGGGRVVEGRTTGGGVTRRDAKTRTRGDELLSAIPSGPISRLQYVRLTVSHPYHPVAFASPSKPLVSPRRVSRPTPTTSPPPRRRRRRSIRPSRRRQPRGPPPPPPSASAGPSRVEHPHRLRLARRLAPPRRSRQAS